MATARNGRISASRKVGAMAGSSYDKRRLSLAWLLAIAVILYAAASGGVAVATAGKCGPYDGPKQWQLLPPHWECR
jgi:hypothetical protein